MVNTKCFSGMEIPASEQTFQFIISALLFTATLLILIFLALKKQITSAVLPLVSIGLSDICWIIWVYSFQRQVHEQCPDPPESPIDPQVIRTCAWLTGLFGMLWMILFSVPYWKLAIDYWNMSFSIERVLQPLQCNQEPRTVRCLKVSVPVCIIVMPFLWAVCYWCGQILNVSRNIYNIGLGLSLLSLWIVAFIILGLLIHAIRRINRITEQTSL